MEKERVNGSCMGRLGNGTWWAAGVGDADFGSWCVIIMCAVPLHHSQQARRRASTRAWWRWMPQTIGQLSRTRAFVYYVSGRMGSGGIAGTGIDREKLSLPTHRRHQHGFGHLPQPICLLPRLQPVPSPVPPSPRPPQTFLAHLRRVGLTPSHPQGQLPGPLEASEDGRHSPRPKAQDRLLLFHRQRHLRRRTGSYCRRPEDHRGWHSQLYHLCHPFRSESMLLPRLDPSHTPQTHTVRRRYSAFLSLHQALTGLYPVLIIPPIPSKQSLTDYAVKGQSKAREDATIIARRKRLLEDFLKRLIRHPILGGEHVLHRFLEEDVSWVSSILCSSILYLCSLRLHQSEVLHSPPISLLSKNPLHAPSHNPTFQPTSPTSPSEAPATTSYIAHHLLPTPSPSHPLRQPDQRFMDSEAFTEKFQSHFSGTMEKVNRRVTKRWGERAHDMSELGGIWNGFSLLEQGKLGEAIEKVGRAVDADYLATAALVRYYCPLPSTVFLLTAQYLAAIMGEDNN